MEYTWIYTKKGSYKTTLDTYSFNYLVEDIGKNLNKLVNKEIESILEFKDLIDSYKNKSLDITKQECKDKIKVIVNILLEHILNNLIDIVGYNHGLDVYRKVEDEYTDKLNKLVITYIENYKIE